MSPGRAPSPVSLRASNSTATSRGSRSSSQSGLFFTAGAHSSPFAMRQWPPVVNQPAPIAAREKSSWNVEPAKWTGASPRRARWTRATFAAATQRARASRPWRRGGGAGSGAGGGEGEGAGAGSGFRPSLRWSQQLEVGDLGLHVLAEARGELRLDLAGPLAGELEVRADL